MHINTLKYPKVVEGLSEIIFMLYEFGMSEEFIKLGASEKLKSLGVNQTFLRGLQKSCRLSKKEMMVTKTKIYSVLDSVLP